VAVLKESIRNLSVERVSGLEPLVLMRVDVHDVRATISICGFGDVPNGITMLHQISDLCEVTLHGGLGKNAHGNPFKAF